MINADRELYDHTTTKKETETYDPNERCFPNGPFHDIEAIELTEDEVQCDSHTPTYRCRHCGHVWCVEPQKLKKLAQKKSAKA